MKSHWYHKYWQLIRKPPERCRSGLSSRFRKPVCSIRVPRVRIPPSPFFLCGNGGRRGKFGIGLKLGLIPGALPTSRDKLRSSIGFVFQALARWSVLIIPCYNSSYVQFGYLQIGFVLHKKGDLIDHRLLVIDYYAEAVRETAVFYGGFWLGPWGNCLLRL